SLTKAVTVRSVNGAGSVTIDGNHATRCVYMDHAGAVLDGFTVQGGYIPGGFGGAINVVNGGTVQNCILQGNQARDGGGAAIDNAGLIVNCVIRDNLASDNGSSGYGGGVRLLNGGTVRGCLIVRNTSRNYGGGVNVWNAGRVENCTIVSNAAPNGAGIRTRQQGIVVNSILYFNNGLDWQLNGSGYAYTNCCTPGASGLPGSGNLAGDPLFAGLATGDFHLQSGSPCRNAGIFQPWMTGAKDLDGNDRVLETAVDIGVYESAPPAVCDVALFLSADVPAPNPGDTVRFTLVATNLGPGDASVVRIADVLPAGLTPGGSTPSQGTYAGGVWDVGALAAGGSATLTLAATVDAGTGGTALTNTAVLSAVTPADSQPANDSAHVSIRIPLVDLSVAKTVDDARPNEGGMIVYTVTAANAGPDAATGVAIRDLPPGGVTYVSDNPSRGSYDAASGVWAVGTLDPGAGATLVVRATVDLGTAGGADIENAASVHAVNEEQGTRSNDTAVASIHVPLVDVSVAKAVAVEPDSSPNANVGDTVTFTVTAANAGPDFASAVRVTDALPAGFSMTGHSATLGAYDGTTWSIPQLHVGTNAVLTVTAAVAPGTGGTTLTNAAAVASVAEKDANGGNDRARACVYVELADLELLKTGEMSDVPLRWSIPLHKGGEYRVIVDNQAVPAFHMWGVGDLKGPAIDRNFHHVVCRFTRGVQSYGPHVLDLFIDGVKVASRGSGGIAVPGAQPLRLGFAPDPGVHYGGAMDEVRLSRAGRSDAWIATSFAQQSDPAGFLEVGAGGAGTMYARRKSLAIHAAKVAGDLSDFPVLVDVTDPELRTAAGGGHVQNAQGWDIGFTLPDGTPLDHEIERYVGSEGRLTAWVRVPAVSASADTTILMHYGDASVAAATVHPAGVWDADFAMVQHMDEVSGPLADSTANGNDGTATGAAYVEFGRTAGAYAFDGIDDAVEIPHAASLALTQGSYTLECWISRRKVPADAMFRVLLGNNGPDGADEVRVDDRMGGLVYAGHFTRAGTHDPGTGQWNVGTLVAGGVATNWILANRTATGTVQNCAEVMTAEQADPDSAHGNHAASEDDQSCVTIGGAVFPPWMLADFEVVDIAFAPAALSNGCSFGAGVTVRNKGDIPGDAGVLKLWLDRPVDAVPSDAADRTVPVGMLAVGELRTITVAGLTAPAADGTYHFRAFVDGTDATAEKSEGNNQKTSVYTFAPVPSLAPDFDIVAIGLQPASPTPGAALTVAVTVRNKGDTTGDAGLLKLWVDRAAPAGSGDAGDAATAVGALAPGQVRVITFAGLVAPAAGWPTLRAFVDGADVTIEKS
ncbi:MAG: DUF2341 domain-containing protein, partial [Verrucomicrobia bacterium]|nr:DUF2341 domain-containing protein [Verrucomicrobiota bacterium]